MTRIEDAIQQKKFDSEYQKLSVNLMYTASQMSMIHQRFFRQFGLTIPQYNVLRILRGQKGKPIGINDLANRMIDRSSNASRLVERLRTKNLVERKVSAEDRRQMEVFITEEGGTLLATIDKQMHETNAVFSSISESEAQKLNALLDQLRNADIFNSI